MAGQGGSFAGFSSGVPTTGQQGQGLAQVFTPQAIGLDTSAIERAGAAIGGAIQQDRAKADAADAAKRAEVQKKLNDRKSGIYNINQEAFNTGLEYLRGQYVNGQLTEDEYQTQIDNYIKNVESIRAYETNVIKPEQAKFIDDETAFILDPSGEGGAYADVKTYAEGTSYLSEGLDETAQELIRKDPNLGLYKAYLQEKHQNTRENFAKKDPDWSLGGALLSDDAFAQFVSQADETTKAKIGQFDSDYDRKQFVTQDEDIREDYKEYIKTQRPDIMGKWVKQKKFDEGLSNQYVSNVLFSDDYKPYVAQAFSEAVDEVILPGAKSKTREDFVRSPKDDDDGSGDGGGLDFSSGAGFTTLEYDEKGDKYSKRKVLGIGDVTIGGEKVAGTTFVDGKELAVSAGGSIIPDSEDKAKTYANNALSRLNDAEKQAYQKARREAKNSKPIVIQPSEEKEKLFDKKLQEFGSTFGDDEQAFVDFLVAEAGIDREENKDVLKDIKNYLKDNDVANFTKPEHRKAIVTKMKKEVPWVFATEGEVDVQQEKDTTKKTESGGVKFKMSNGYEYTREQLKEAGWSDAQIDALNQ